MPEYHLITFPPAQDSELGRFLLSHYKIPYAESRHIFFFSSIFTLARAGTIYFPAFYGGGLRLAGPERIRNYFEAKAAAELKLLPADVDAKALQADWDHFRSVLNTASRRFAYYHLVGQRELLIHSFSDGTPRFEKWFIRTFYRLFASFLRLTLRLDPAHEKQSREIAEEEMRLVDERLSDGRPYLLGDRLTQSDIIFAVGAAALVWPEEYGGPVPALDVMPAAIQELAKTLRERPSGQHALRIYREHRGSGPVP
jgi:glutathione S-transferase